MLDFCSSPWLCVQTVAGLSVIYGSFQRARVPGGCSMLCLLATGDGVTSWLAVETSNVPFVIKLALTSWVTGDTVSRLESSWDGPVYTTATFCSRSCFLKSLILQLASFPDRFNATGWVFRIWLESGGFGETYYCAVLWFWLLAATHSKYILTIANKVVCAHAVWRNFTSERGCMLGSHQVWVFFCDLVSTAVIKADESKIVGHKELWSDVQIIEALCLKSNNKINTKLLSWMYLWGVSCNIQYSCVVMCSIICFYPCAGV